jgi:hypothetical protein
MTNRPIDPSNEIAAVASEIGSYWIPKRRELVERLWAEGWSFGAIAYQLGTTRSTIAGYIRRAGLHRGKQEAHLRAIIRAPRRPRATVAALSAPPKLLALPAPEPRQKSHSWRRDRNPQPEDFPHGSREQMECLEQIRRHQERVWFEVGYSRDQIVKMFAGWPANCGYRPYEWTVGQPR